MPICDKSSSLPSFMEDLLQKMADQHNDTYCCWHLRETPPGVKDFAYRPYEILNGGPAGGTITDSGDIWGIFFEDDIKNRSMIKDFEVYIYNGGTKNTPLGSNHAKAYKDCAKKCVRPQSRGITERVQSSYSGPRNVKLDVGTPTVPRSLGANSKLNWYKQAQAARFEPEMLDDVKNLDKFTQEQWQAARDWASKQPQWTPAEGEKANWGAKQGAIDILYNNDEFNRRKSRATMGSAMISESNTGVESLRRYLPLITGYLGELNSQVSIYSSEGSFCPINLDYYPSEDATMYTNVAGIKTAISKAYAAIVQAMSQRTNFAMRKFLGSAANNSRLLTIICNAQKHAAKIQEQAPAMIAHIDAVLKDQAHPEHEAAKRLVQDLTPGRAVASGIVMPRGLTNI